MYITLVILKLLIQKPKFKAILIIIHNLLVLQIIDYRVLYT